MVEEVGDLNPSLQYYIGNTPGKADETVIRKVLEKCAVPLQQAEDGPLVLEKIQLLTKEQEPRTKCWRVIVPHKFKALMENSMLYPEGWRYREFVGNLRNSNTGPAAKRTRTNGNSVVDQVMVEEEQKKQVELNSLLQEVAMLRQQVARVPAADVPNLMQQ